MLQVFVVGLLFSFAQISAGKQWNFTEAYAIINSIEQRLGARPSHKDFIPLLHDIKRQLFNFETTVVSRKDNVLKPHSITETKARNREFIEGEQTMYNEEGVDTFKGQKVIHVDDNVEGRLGKWLVLEAMERLLDFIPSNVTDAERICRPGPLHDTQDESGSTTVEQEKKCLILGDSISIGYFWYVADLLEDDCTVHHAPWSGDGGSLDTSYLLKCLPMFLSSSVYEPVKYDAIIFNSGLHDINCCGFPREYVPLKKYAKNLRKIKEKLLKTGAMIAFATSTPVPYNETANEILQEYNKAATKEMERDDPIDIVDLYKAVIEACNGEALSKCDLYLEQPELHLNGDGYMSLAKEVSKGFKSLLKKDTDERKRRLKASKERNDNMDSRKYCIQHTEESMQDVRQLTGCPANTTCCINEYSNSFIGCCMLEDAMDCGDSWHCCPKGTVCDPTCSKTHCSCREAPWESKATRTTFSTLMKSLDTFWKKLAKQYS